MFNAHQYLITKGGNMRLLIALLLLSGVCFAEELALDADRLEIRQENVYTETREDLEHIISDNTREMEICQSRITEAQRKLSLLNNERQRLIDEDR